MVDDLSQQLLRIVEQLAGRRAALAGRRRSAGTFLSAPKSERTATNRCRLRVRSAGYPRSTRTPVNSGIAMSTESQSVLKATILGFGVGSEFHLPGFVRLDQLPLQVPIVG